MREPNREQSSLLQQDVRASLARDPGLEQQLAHFLKGRICMLGIGDRYWRDDGVGSLIAEALQPCPEFEAIDAGCVPENYLERGAGKNPDAILMIDATDFGGTPGEVRLLETDNIAQSGLSTHAGSMHMLASYLQARTGAQIALLAIQPADSSAGEDLSLEVSRTALFLEETLPAIVGASLGRESEIELSIFKL